ncbi:MAG: hypothetical protein H6765_04335 [Candidatus Peribacteria bacterium]|nr:MAG: hypothetical protein H6765_04335 [Candidatus Peribacteria bacterium]
MLIGGIFSGFVMTIVDTFWNRANAICERKAPYRILLCSDPQASVLQQVSNAFAHYTIYQTDSCPLADEVPSLKGYDILLVV